VVSASASASAAGEPHVVPAVSEHQRCGGAGFCREGTQAMSLVVQAPVLSWLKVTRTSSPRWVPSTGVYWAAMLLPSP